MSGRLMSPLRHLDARAISEAAQAESRNREVHLPPVSAYRWWARRTVAVNGKILEAAARDHGQGGDASSPRMLVADIFAGGGVIPLAAVLAGHKVYAQDLNPWAAFGLHGMLDLPPAGALASGMKTLFPLVEPILKKAYATVMADGEPGDVSHTFRVATAHCPGCGCEMRLFPHAMVTLERRVERGETGAFLACPRGHLFRGHSDKKASCPECGARTDPATAYTSRRRVRCLCGHEASLEQLASSGTWGWEVVLVERAAGWRRELSLPTSAEIRQADHGWKPRRVFPEIPRGREAAVLTRHGFVCWHDLYPGRQRQVMERMLEEVETLRVPRKVAGALRLAALGVAEMAGLASRWDRYYLKSYETMAAHRFNFTTFTAEPNVWGARASGRGTFRRRVALLEKAAAWLERQAGKQRVVRASSTARRRRLSPTTDVMVVEGSSERLLAPRGSVDLVLTDPPYHDDVQYNELSMPFRVWAGLQTDRLPGDAVAVEAGRSAYDAYRRLLERIFRETARALSPQGHLVFSYANREPEAWVAVFRALHDAGFQAAGYAVVHSENEKDHAKRHVRACSLDLILDLVRAGAEVTRSRPKAIPPTPEGDFLRLVGNTLLNNVGRRGDGWPESFVARARKERFLSK